jgi:hypothetical protein
MSPLLPDWARTPLPCLGNRREVPAALRGGHRLKTSGNLNRPDLSMALRATTADENGEDAPAEHRSP